MGMPQGPPSRSCEWGPRMDTEEGSCALPFRSFRNGRAAQHQTRPEAGPGPRVQGADSDREQVRASHPSRVRRATARPSSPLFLLAALGARSQCLFLSMDFCAKRNYPNSGRPGRWGRGVAPSVQPYVFPFDQRLSKSGIPPLWESGCVCGRREHFPGWLLEWLPLSDSVSVPPNCSVRCDVGREFLGELV